MEVHFQFLGTGVILQNEFSLHRICPPDVSFQTKGETRFWSLVGQKKDLTDIGYLGCILVVERLIGSRYFSDQSRTECKAATNPHSPRPNQ